MYVILGDDKCILIDSGCGTGDYRDFVTTNINKRRLPYLVINTHVHFDHIGGNHRFCGAHKEGCIDVCMGCENTTFSKNVEINSLAIAHSVQVKAFTVSRWLSEGELIYLNDAKPSRELSLEVIFLPGHTPDSIGLYAHWEKRLFVGDVIYPFTTIHVDGIGSNVADYVNSLNKLAKFISRQENPTSNTDTEKNPTNTSNTSNTTTNPTTPPTNTTTTNASTPTPAEKAKMEEFCTMLGIDKPNFSVEALMGLCDWDTSSAVDFYLTNSSEVAVMCPPTTTTITQVARSSAPANITLSCGHVECNLPSSAVSEILSLLDFIKSGALPPQHLDGEFGEFSNGNFALMLPLKPKWNLYTKKPEV